MDERSLFRRITNNYRRKGMLSLTKASLQYASEGAVSELLYRVTDLLYRHRLDVYNRTELYRYADWSQEFDEGGSFEIGRPSHASRFPPEFSYAIGSYQFDDPFVAEIEDARVLPTHGISTAPDYTILLESISSRRDILERYLNDHLLELARLLAHQTVPSRKSNNSEELGTACSLIRAPYPESNMSYSHWVQSFLPRIQAVEQYAERTDTEPKLIVEPNPPSWMIESLNLFGYTDEDVVLWNPDQTLRVRNLIVPSVRRIEHDVHWYSEASPLDRTYCPYKIIDPRSMLWIRETATSRLSEDIFEKQIPNKVLISRADADDRRIRNREKLLDILSPRGFEKYELGNLTFEQQVRLFAEADTIVSPHGAGLANMAFANDCTIIEIFGSKLKPTYYMLAEILGFDYRPVLAEPVGQNIRIDPSSIAQIEANRR